MKGCRGVLRELVAARGGKTVVEVRVGRNEAMYECEVKRGRTGERTETRLFAVSL